MDVAELQHKINSLTRERDQARIDVVQSATNGLHKLDNYLQSLTKRDEVLENLYENVKQEIEMTYKLQQEVEHLCLRIEQVQAIQENIDSSRLSNNSKQLLANLLEVKSRETRLLSDCSELKQDNITLRKQIAHFKSFLGSQIRSLEHIGTQTSHVVTDNKTEGGKSINATLEYYQRWFSLASKDIDQLHGDLEELERQLNSSEETLSLKDELIMLKNKLLDREQKTMEFESDVRLSGELATDTSTSLNNTRNDLVVITDKLAQLALQMSMLNGKSIKFNTIVIKTAEEVENDTSLDVLQKRLKSRAFIKDLERPTEDSFVVKSLRNALDQIKLLKESVNTSKDNAKAGNRDNKDGQRRLMMENNDELSDLREQVMKLQSLLATKEEKISSLSMVLKTNQNNAEVALNNLKSKNNNEKMIVTETTTKLHNEQRTLKEDDATLSSLIAMCASRSEEEVYDLQQQLVDAEEENMTLKKLLRLSVQQKMMVTQKLEEIEKNPGIEKK